MTRLFRKLVLGWGSLPIPDTWQTDGRRKDKRSVRQVLTPGGSLRAPAGGVCSSVNCENEKHPDSPGATLPHGNRMTSSAHAQLYSQASKHSSSGLYNKHVTNRAIFPTLHPLLYSRKDRKEVQVCAGPALSLSPGSLEGTNEA